MNEVADNITRFRKNLQQFLSLKEAGKLNGKATAIEEKLKDSAEIAGLDFDAELKEVQGKPQTRMNPEAPEFYGIDVVDNPDLDDEVRENRSVSPDEIYQMITDSMINTIKKVGHLPWQKEWDETGLYGGRVATNFVSGNPYRGINYILLNYKIVWKNDEPILAPRKLENPFFLTFNQVEKLDGKIKKGSYGERVVYFTRLYQFKQADPELEFSTYDRKKMIAWLNKNRGQIKVQPGREFNAESIADSSWMPILKYYNVFNGSNIEGIDWGEIPENENSDLDESQKIKVGDMIWDHFPNKPELKHDQPRAFYMPAGDFINMPKLQSFSEPQFYYTTLFHEAIHSTGYKTRLDRDLTGRKGSKSYAFEELVAELGATFLCAESGILFKTRDNSAKYLAGWNKRLVKNMEDDNRFFFRASSRAQAAADYILDRDAENNPAYRKDFKKLEEKEEKQPLKVDSKKLISRIKPLFKSVDGAKFTPRGKTGGALVSLPEGYQIAVMANKYDWHIDIGKPGKDAGNVASSNTLKSYFPSDNELEETLKEAISEYKKLSEYIEGGSDKKGRIGNDDTLILSEKDFPKNIPFTVIFKNNLHHIKLIENASEVKLGGELFWVSKIDGDWRVFDKETGLNLSTGKLKNTKKAAIEDAEMRLAQSDKSLKELRGNVVKSILKYNRDLTRDEKAGTTKKDGKIGDEEFDFKDPEIVSINDIEKGQFVYPVSRIMTEKGFYFTPTTLLEVIRVNKKSITVKKVKGGETTRIKRKAIRQSFSGDREEVTPEFRLIEKEMRRNPSWSDKSLEKVSELDKEFYKLVAEKGIQPDSKEATALWEKEGFQERFKKINKEEQIHKLIVRIQRLENFKNDHSEERKKLNKLVGKDGWKWNDRRTKINIVKENPAGFERPSSARFIFLGIMDSMKIDQAGKLVELQGPHALFTNKKKDKIYVAPFDLIKEFPSTIRDKKAEEIFKEWNNYSPDHKDLLITWPSEKDLPVGSAHDIHYISDKVLQEGDRKGKMNVYHHEFDPGKRPAAKKGNVLIVGNLEIDERGILN